MPDLARGFNRLPGTYVMFELSIAAASSKFLDFIGYYVRDTIYGVEEGKS